MEANTTFVPFARLVEEMNDEIRACGEARCVCGCCVCAGGLFSLTLAMSFSPGAQATSRGGGDVQSGWNG